MQFITPKEYAKKTKQTEQNVTRKIRLYQTYFEVDKSKAQKYAAKHFPHLKSIVPAGNRKIIVLRKRIA